MSTEVWGIGDDGWQPRRVASEAPPAPTEAAMADRDGVGPGEADAAYEWCRRQYEATGGATPELRQAYALYQAAIGEAPPDGDAADLAREVERLREWDSLRGLDLITLAQKAGEAEARAVAAERERDQVKVENERLRKLLDVPADLRAIMARASQGAAYTSGPPWFRRGDVVLVGSPDPNAGTIIADCDPVDMRHDYREAGREVLDAADDATVLAAAWNRLRAQAAALASRPSRGDAARAVDETPTCAENASGDKGIVSTGGTHGKG